MNMQRRVESLRKRVLRSIQRTMGTEPFTGDPRALRSYLELQLEPDAAGRERRRPIADIAREVLRLQLVRSLTPHQQRLMLYRKRLAASDSQSGSVAGGQRAGAPQGAPSFQGGS